ncbi:MAG: helix-turn-helix domain-containing protein [Rhodospirillales bacterium]|nr:helix-turn-helix domain-containing protein [Rhodospirillales bacterium]MDP6642768.1 helix-turn-helix domain-containing protein [Rhodospirillales bacterium]MDP6841500.1 helix-turn-helix domain-containing protein [Rhodospirillales bacterium]
MSGNKYIRSLERGLEVLLALQERRQASLHELAQTTQLPKSTVKRILSTLERAGFLYRSIGDHQYRISVNVQRITRHLDDRDKLLEAAKPVLENLCRTTIWPADVLVRHDDMMVVAESSRALSPFNISHDNIGFLVHFLVSASGRAYLAFCPNEERIEIITKLKQSGDASNRLAKKPAELDKILAETRQRRYAIRDPAYGGGYGLRRPVSRDGLSAMAVPILDHSEVQGVISMVWFPTAMTLGRVVDEYLPALWQAADEIAELLPAANG